MTKTTDLYVAFVARLSDGRGERHGYRILKDTTVPRTGEQVQALVAELKETISADALVTPLFWQEIEGVPLAKPGKRLSPNYELFSAESG